jgi:putative hydrolase of the HAD superfamily
MSQIAWILLDLNGVLYHYDRAARINRLAAASRCSHAQIKAGVWESGFEDSGDAGSFDADTYLRRFGTAIGYQLSEAEWVHALQAAIAPIEANLALLPRIRGGVGCAVLTNNNLLVQRHFAALYPEVAARVGQDAHVSAEFGARKPDPEAFLRCLGRIGAAPEDVLFIDDSDANVAGARAAGLAGYHATSPDGLATELRARGIIA